MTGIDLNILALVRGNETYLWLYHDHQLADVQRSLGRFASNPDLAFTWYDAAVCAARARQQIQHEAVKSCQRSNESVSDGLQQIHTGVTISRID
jgi:hypothetical protein